MDDAGFLAGLSRAHLIPPPGGMNLQVAKEHYFSNYDSKQRFCSYWTQIEYVLKLQAQPVLEIGVGTRMVSNYLAQQGVPMVTLDLDPALEPTVVGSITQLPFKTGSFDLVMACEVLEHLPFEQFIPTLTELARVSRQYAIISVPNVGRVWQYQLHLPGVGMVRKTLDLSWWRRRQKPVGVGQHYWELEVAGYPQKRIEACFGPAGWKLMEQQRVWEMPGHHFFILKKAA
jgi:hypothetical protein